MATLAGNGERLRLPIDKTYYVSVTSDRKCSIDLKLSEYSVYDGREARSVTRDDDRRWTGITMKPGRTLTLKVSKTSVTMNRGGKHRINARVVNAAGGRTIDSQTKKIKYASSSSRIASVSSKGVITAKKKGSCTVTVSAPGGLKRRIKVTVK